MKDKNILILSPHTDDAELGCGGTIVKLLEAGNNILWVAFSTAEESLPPGFPKDTLVKEFRKVTESLGLGNDHVIIHDFKVRKLSERRQDVLEELIKIRKEFHPDIVVGPSLKDHHQDHHVVANEMIRAFKSSSSIICYELPWNHIEFNTQMFVKLSDAHIRRKIEILNFYRSQFYVQRAYLTEDFIRGLAFTRGAQVGHQFAEAFEVIRWIE